MVLQELFLIKTNVFTVSMSTKHTPDISELLPERQYRCEHCTDQVFGNQSHYSMHLRRRHKMTPVNREETITTYHCPVENCIYHVARQGSRGFSNLRFLRQHYQKTHMRKEFKCNECNEAFLLERHLTNHQCCSAYPCSVCGLTYSSKASLQTHMRRKNHLSCSSDSYLPGKAPSPTTKVSIPRLKPCREPPKRVVNMVNQSTSTEETIVENSVNVRVVEPMPPTDSPMQPSYYCLPDIEIPFALQTATQTDDSVDMDVAIQTAINVALKERENSENGLPMPNLTYDEVDRLLRDMETQTEDVDLHAIDMHTEVLAPPLRNIQTQTLDNRQHQGTMTDVEQTRDTGTDRQSQSHQSTSAATENFVGYQEQEAIFGPQNSAHMHTQTCDELFEELGLSHIQTQTNWPDGLYNTQHTQTCDEMLEELLENFQSTCTQTRWLDWQEADEARD